MRHTRSQTRQRRSHHALTGPTLSACGHCGAPHLPHHMCRACGWYNGRQILDLVSEKAKREKRLKENRERIHVDSGVPATAPAPEEKSEVMAEEKPQATTRAAKGAAAKRRKDESLSESSFGTE